MFFSASWATLVLASTADNCDGHLGPPLHFLLSLLLLSIYLLSFRSLGPDYCLLKQKIPCHDLSCQLSNPSFKCHSGNTPAACAPEAATACTLLKDCVAFAIYNHPKPGVAGRVEWYNETATCKPLDSQDWDYYFNMTALGPPPPPPPTCVPGPSKCPPAPPGSIFPPPGDFPPGCNHKGCTTLPTLTPKFAATYQMNKSSLIMPCNNTGSTDPQSTKGETSTQ